MEWIVKRSCRQRDESLDGIIPISHDTPIEEVYRGESRLMAWLVYRWCTLLSCPVVMMYNAPAEEVLVKDIVQAMDESGE